MTAHSAAHPAPRFNKLALNRLGLWLFMLSETMIFIILLAVRFVLFGAGKPEGIEVDQFLGLVITIILLASSISAYRAETAMAHGDRKAFERNMLLTILMGTVFLLAVVAWEWPLAPHHGLKLTEGFGIAFFAMTGMHAFHVLTGVALLVIVYLNARRGAFSPDSYWGVEATVKYWHFVDLVWVFFYPALYLLQ